MRKNWRRKKKAHHGAIAVSRWESLQRRPTNVFISPCIRTPLSRVGLPSILQNNASKLRATSRWRCRPSVQGQLGRWLNPAISLSREIDRPQPGAHVRWKRSSARSSCQGRYNVVLSWAELCLRHCVSPRILVGKQRTGEDWEDTRPGNLLQFAIENGHRNSEISHDTWWFPYSYVSLPEGIFVAQAGKQRTMRSKVQKVRVEAW